MKKEIFEKLCAIVGDVCKVKDLRSTNRAENVDARVILINIMRDQGESEKSICSFLSMSQQRVNYLKNVYFRKIKNRRFKRLYDEAKEITGVFLGKELSHGQSIA